MPNYSSHENKMKLFVNDCIHGGRAADEEDREVINCMVKPFDRITVKVRINLT